jgi:peptidoglycan/LPS O-acetylase OafA/YrhL
MHRKRSSPHTKGTQVLPRPGLYHPKYRPDIDGLRAIAVLSVVLYHAFPKVLNGGFIGVDIFFVISGFLISTIIFESLDKTTFSFRTFYARRIARIFPALIVVLSATLCFGWLVLLSDELNQLGRHALAGAGFVANFVFWDEVSYFDTAAEAKPLLHLWSLSIEEQFYLLWPLLIWLIWHFRTSVPWIMAGLVIVSFWMNVVLVSSDPVAAFYSPLPRFWELMCGALLAWHVLNKDQLTASASRWQMSIGAVKWLPDMASVFGLLLIVFGLFAIEKDDSFPGYWALFPVLGTVLLIAAGTTAFVNRTILSTRVMIWFGLISFPLYLWHWPLLSFSQIIHAGDPPRNLKVILVLIAVLLAWLTFKIIERPFRFSVHRQGMKTAFLAACVACIGLVGFFFNRVDFSATHNVATVSIARPDFALGSSFAWYRGSEDWLFLGNAHQDSVAKLKLAVHPTNADVSAVQDSFSQVTAAASLSGTTVALLVGPNKETIYPEFLPEGLTPSAIRYSDFFLDGLRSIPELVLYDPTEDFLRLKPTEGPLYWRTDTHWNSKGSYFALAGLLDKLNLPVPSLSFKPGPPYRGDLVDIARLENFPLRSGDDWAPVWPMPPSWRATPSSGPANPTFTEETILNDSPLVDMTVWVIGDSFTNGLRPYLNRTFRNVRYVGHWQDSMPRLAALLEDTDEVPDLILIVRVERSF